MPSGTRRSPSSSDSWYVSTTRCLSLRRSELRRGADVFVPLSGFLNIGMARALLPTMWHVSARSPRSDSHCRRWLSF